MSEPLYSRVDPAEYVKLAKTLSSQAAEAAKRTAADRAYYGAFLASRDLLEQKGYITPYGDERDHQYVNEQLQRGDVLGTLGSQGLRLRRARNAATYDTRDITPETQRYARPLNWMVETAEEIVAKVKNLPLKSPTSR